MKLQNRKGISRWTLLLAGLAFGSLLLSCGADKTDPSVKTLDELQNAKGLTIKETGTGTATLTWVGTNGEDDFTGYNIYGAKMSDELLDALNDDQVAEGDSLLLVDAEGEPRPLAKSILQLMSYNGKDFETPATANPTDDDVKFQFYPIYTTKDVFPTCLPTEPTGTDKACKPLTEEGKESTFFGTTTYEVAGLVPGSQYCFLVLSTLDSGKTVAMTTTELACVTPMIHASDLNLVIADKSHQKIDMKASRDACTTTTCAITPVAYTRTTGTFCDNDAETTDLLCVEQVAGSPGLTGGQFVSINDLGYYGDGFSDSTLQKDLPLLTEYNSAADTIAYGGGYAISGQTLPILENHIYVIASRMDTSDAPTAFYYDLYYAKSVSTTAVKFEVRIDKNK
jgi:hypothetical protein